MDFRSLYSDGLRLRLLPPKAACATCGRECIFRADEYDGRLAQIQQLRARVFLADGAIAPHQLDENGGYKTTLDHQGWHVYLSGRDDDVRACYTPMLHRKGVRVEELRVYELLTRMDEERRGPYTLAIQRLMEQAEARNIGFGEVAAWAVEETVRNRRSSMMIAVAGWPLFQMLGNALIIGAPTLRHQTSSIERRLGGSALILDGPPLGTFYNACYGCDMEFVWFDSSRPQPKFSAVVAEIRSYFEQLNQCECRKT